jgi:predicted permease
VDRPVLPSLLLRLYPRSFRERFGKEWWEVVAWHRRALRDRPLAGVRLALVLLADTTRSLPGAWADRLAGSSALHFAPSWAELRHAGRSLRRNKAFSVAAVASVAVGIGVNSAVFSVANAVLLRPLPYDDPGRLTAVWSEFPASDLVRVPLTGPQIQMLRDEPGLFEEVAGVWATSASMVGRDGRVNQVSLALATPNLFHLLGTRPARGRFWDRDDSTDRSSGRPEGVVLSHEFWAGRLGADQDVVGGALDLDGRTVRVLGILPRGFTLFFPEDAAIPPSLDVYAALPWNLAGEPAGQHYLRVIGRLRPGVGPAEAARVVAAVGDRARTVYPELASTGDLLSVRPLQEDAVRATRPVLLALVGAVGLFLVLVSANVASLIVARTAARDRELTIRASLGASRTGLARLVVAESLLVTLAGAFLGVGSGHLTAAALWDVRPPGLSRAAGVPLDARVLGFGLALAGLSALAFALISLFALRTADPSLRFRSGATSAGGRGGRRLREALTAAQVAVGLVLVVGSTLMVRSVGSLGRESIGFEPGRALTFRVPLPLRVFPTDAERTRLANEVERRLAGLPAVRAVGATSHLPFDHWANWAEAAPPRSAPDEARSEFFADLRAVTPGYLAAVGARLVEGRLLDGRDRADGTPVVVVDETMAERAFPGGDAVGRVLEPSRFAGGEFVVTPATVVGVIEDVRDRSPALPSSGQVFWPFAQSPRWELAFFVRTSGDPLALADAVRAQVSAAHPDLTVARLTPMAAHVARATAPTRFLARVGSVFSLLALATAAIGLYGVVAFATVRRTGEIAVRMTVGASRGRILRGTLAHGVKVGTVGVVAGLGAALLLGRALEGLVYGVSVRDPATFVGVGLALLAVALVASLAPALRATRIDPAAAMREP